MNQIIYRKFQLIDNSSVARQFCRNHLSNIDGIVNITDSCFGLCISYQLSSVSCSDIHAVLRRLNLLPAITIWQSIYQLAIYFIEDNQHDNLFYRTGWQSDLKKMYISLSCSKM